MSARGFGQEARRRSAEHVRPRASSSSVTVGMFGLFESALMALLPIWGVRSGLSERMAAGTLSAVYFGAIALQVLIGWLSDRVSRLAALRLCGAVGLVGAVAAAERAGLAAGAVRSAVRVGRGGVGDLSGGAQHGGGSVSRRRSCQRQCRDDHRVRAGWPDRSAAGRGGDGYRQPAGAAVAVRGVVCCIADRDTAMGFAALNPSYVASSYDGRRMG